MFKKKPNIKPFAPLRSSDRRKLADQIIKDFEVPLPQPQNEPNSSSNHTQVPDVAPILTDIRNSLVPDNALSARFTTTVGPELKQVSGTVYSGAHPHQEQRILWYRIEDILTPTVYTLWHNPYLVPLLHTPDFVVQKLQNGSPLMTPGLANGPPFPPRATKGAIVAVASIDRPTTPLVVGTCEIDVASLGRVQGAKGHAVRSEHWEGDELWTWSITGKQGTKAPDHLEGWAVSVEKELQDGMKEATLDDEEEDDKDGGVPLTAAAPQEKKSQNAFVEGEEPEGSPQTKPNGAEKQLTTKEIDDAFWQAFLYGVHNARTKHKDDARHGLKFPIPQSNVISDLVLPYLPIHSPSQASFLSIKKTSWKNAKKFIKALDKAKILKSKDRDGGECVVLDIDFEDQAILNFKPYKLPQRAEPTSGSNGNTPSATNTSDSSLNQRLQLLLLYKPKDAIASIFTDPEDTNADAPQSYYLPSELRTIITTYIERESLVNQQNKRLVNLTPYLSHALFPNPSTSSIDAAIVAKNSIPRDALIDRIRDHLCTPHYLLLRNTETLSSSPAKPKSGKPPRTTIILETRGGNKVVTKVSGLEVFGIEPRLLGDELQRVCASSTSVGQAAGSSPRQPVMEVLVQGNQRERVMGALEKRGVRREWVDVVDKTKGKGKGRR